MKSTSKKTTSTLPELKFSQLTKRIYIVVNGEKTDVTEQFQSIIVMFMTPPDMASPVNLVRVTRELKIAGETMFELTIEKV